MALRRLKEIFNRIKGKYKLDVELWQERSGKPVKIKDDKARFIEERKGKRYFYLFSAGITITPRVNPYDYITADNKLKLIQTSKDNYQPFVWDFSNIEEGDVKAKVGGIPEDVRFWISQEFREADMRHKTSKGIWQKYGNLISAFLILIGSGVMFYMLNQGMSKNIGQLTKIYEGLKPILQGIEGGGF